MAKRTCAPAPARASAHRPSPRRYIYTPELLAHGRHRYEETDDSITDIAVEFGVHKTTLLRLAKRAGWVRHVPAPRDLPAATRLAAEAAALEEAPPSPNPSPPLATLAGGGEETADTRSDIDRLERGVRTELSVYEEMRARMKGLPQSPLDAERTARTLSSLTATLHRVQHLRAGTPEAAYDNDDIFPTDLDAFRDEIARRIEAFLESREGEEDADGAAGSGSVSGP